MRLTVWGSCNQNVGSRMCIGVLDIFNLFGSYGLGRGIGLMPGLYVTARSHLSTNATIIRWAM